MPSIVGWLFPLDVERVAAQSLLQPDLSAAMRDGLMPGQALWTSLGRLIFEDASLALSFAAGLATSLGIMLVLATTWRLAGRSAALMAAVVTLTLPVTWGLAGRPGPEAFIFFSICLLFLVNTVDSGTILGAWMTTSALIVTILTWSYGAIIWIAWFVLEIHRHRTVRNTASSVVELRPVHIRTLLALILAPLIAIALWPHDPMELGALLTTAIGHPMRVPYPNIRADGVLLVSGLARTPGIVTGLALSAAAFPLLWTIMAFAQAKAYTRTDHPVRRGTVILSFALVTLVAINGGPWGLRYSGMVCLTPPIIFFAGIGMVRVGRYIRAQRNTAIRILVAVVFMFALSGSLSLLPMRSTSGPRQLGKWQLPGDQSLPAEFIGQLNESLPPSATLHVLEQNSDYRELVASLVARQILRPDIQIKPLYESQFIVVPSTPTSNISELIDDLRGEVETEVIDGVDRYQLIKL